MTAVPTSSLPPDFELFEFSDITLFEIDDQGKVLYCRLDSRPPAAPDSTKTGGANFFERIVPPEKSKEMRQIFAKFIENPGVGRSFDFIWKIKDRFVPLRMCLFRMNARPSDKFAAETTIIDIRKM